MQQKFKSKPLPDDPALLNTCPLCGVPKLKSTVYCPPCFAAYRKDLEAKKDAAYKREIAAAEQKRERAKRAENKALQLDILAPDGKPYVPNRKQLEFHQSDAMVRAMVGGRRSGKSTAAIVEVIRVAFENPGIDILVGQYFRSQLEDGTWKLLKKMLPRELVYQERQDPLELRLANGTTIRGIPLADVKVLGSKCYGAIFVEEISHFGVEDEIYPELLARLTDPIGPNRMWITGYPSGRNWVWRKFFAEPNEYHWGVQVGIEDNRDHLPPNTIERLRANYSDKEQAVYLRGEFLEAEGEIFWMFDEATHVIEPEEDARFGGDSFGVPLHWARYVGIDPGIGDNFAAVWVAVNEDGDMFVYDAVARRNLTISEQCAEIAAKTGTERISWFALDPSVARERNDETGSTKFDLYRKNGIENIRLGPRDKEGHISQIRELLRVDPETGRPKLFFFRNVRALINQVKFWRRTRDGKPQDRNDDLLSALRYVLSTAPSAASSNVMPGIVNAVWERMQRLMNEIDDDDSGFAPIGSLPVDCWAYEARW